ncbi:MAG: hypothetical protein JNN15_01955 [Blastocatellia bacterium]|nr:hypothetical protein [Blastocatellia bacterium]
MEKAAEILKVSEYFNKLSILNKIDIRVEGSKLFWAACVVAVVSFY